MRACTTSAASAGSFSVAAIATAAASAAAAAIAASVATAAVADASVIAAFAVAAAAVSRSPEAAGVSSSSFIHGSLWRRGFLGRALTSCARTCTRPGALLGRSSEAEGARGAVDAAGRAVGSTFGHLNHLLLWSQVLLHSR